MEPVWAALKCGYTALIIVNVPVRLMSIVRLHSASSISSNFFVEMTPAQLMRMLTPGTSSKILSTVSRALAASETSSL